MFSPVPDDGSCSSSSSLSESDPVSFEIPYPAAVKARPIYPAFFNPFGIFIFLRKDKIPLLLPAAPAALPVFPATVPAPAAAAPPAEPAAPAAPAEPAAPAAPAAPPAPPAAPAPAPTAVPAPP